MKLSFTRFPFSSRFVKHAILDHGEKQLVIQQTALRCFTRSLDAYMIANHKIPDERSKNDNNLVRQNAMLLKRSHRETKNGFVRTRLEIYQQLHSKIVRNFFCRLFNLEF